MDLSEYREIIRKRPLYFGLVVGPMFVLAVYLTLIASEGYVSRTLLIVERDSPTASTGLDLGILGLGASTSVTDALLIQDFIGSPAMLDYLQETLDLRSHFRGKGVDFISSLGENAPNERFHRYFDSHLKVAVDSESTVITMEMAAFTPEFAQAVAKAIVKRSEEFLNNISQQMARDQVAYIQGQVDDAAKRMHKAADDLVALQRENKVLSPQAESETSTRIVGGLESELATARTQLKALQSYLNSGAQEVVTVRKRIQAIENQLSQERSRQVGTGGPGVNDLMLRYQAAQLNVQLTTDLYQTALKSLEVTRLDASRKGKYLVQVSSPTLPDQAELPRIWRIMFSALCFLHLGYFLLNLILSVIKDHQD